jgi:hypothetical protein
VRYLTVFQVAPSTKAAATAVRHIISAGGNMEGAQISNQVVLFGFNGDLPAGAVVSYSFNGRGKVQHLLVNLVAGQTYKVIAKGQTQLATASRQGTLTFTTAAGVSRVSLVAAP